MEFKIADGRTLLYQYDTDVLLKLELEPSESCDRVHFTTGGNTAYVATPYEDGELGTVVKVADETLQKGSNLTVFCWVKNTYSNPDLTVEQSGHTYIKQVFEVKPRPKPANYMFTNSGKMSWEEWTNESKNHALRAMEFANASEAIKVEVEGIKDEVVELKTQIEEMVKVLSTKI